MPMIEVISQGWLRVTAGLQSSAVQCSKVRFEYMLAGPCTMQLFQPSEDASGSAPQHWRTCALISACDSLWGPAPHIRLTRSSSTPSGLPHATPHSCMSARREPGQRSAQATRTTSSASLHMPRNSSIRAGESLGDSELIRQTHNSFAAPHSFLSEEARAAKEEDDVFHFISYLPAMGRLWELDGLKPGPIDLGPCSEVQPLSFLVPLSLLETSSAPAA